jgi:DNA-binding response OmpR family regulator
MPSERTLASEANGSSPAGNGGPPGRVLVADDNLALRATLTAEIKAFDPLIEVSGTGTGPETLEALLSARPDAAFVNLQLPLMSGAEALAWARARGVRPFTVLMSGTALPKWIEVSTELQAYEFLTKPFDPLHVRDILRARIRMSVPMRLLLAESSKPTRELIRRVLRESRFALSVNETDNGDHALKLLRLTRYDLVVIDWGLAGLDGLETACQARVLAPEARLMMMTAGDLATIEGVARQFGLAAVLKKPFDACDVEIAIHRAFGLRRPYLLNAVMGRQKAARQPLRAAG